MNIEYKDEWLAPGQWGHLLIIIAFASSLAASLSYFLKIRKEKDPAWTLLGRSFFGIHIISIAGVIGILFWLIYNHRFEYQYVWQHSSKDLPLRYIFSCFWEGQEGSFLLWIFWHTVLSLFIIRKGGEWEAPVMVIIALAQVFLCSMLLGIYTGEYRWGSNPFILLREHPDYAHLSFVQMPDYVSRIEDGRGLNPLLRNYWMTIHPPTLFLGFASTVIPFAFAMGGLMKKSYREWIRPALPWTVFSVAILGTGILMGAAWAYEALSFGGFWAWDPVENASLVPWITLVGALHVMIICKNNGRALLSSILLCAATFILILYSTFLTRSGILGDTSVHAFTDLGMSGQLIFYMAFFAFLAVALIALRWKHLQLPQKDEHIFSREFWMFVGMLTLVISAIQITFTTSIPVINKLFGSHIAPPGPQEVVVHYNSWQLPIAVIICLLSGAAQFLKYRGIPAREFLKKTGPALILSLALSITGSLLIGFRVFNHALLFFASMFALISNADYLLRILKGKMRLSGASVSHIGFALIMMGALLSNAQKKVISRNTTGIDLGKELPGTENILLRKGDTLQMGEYFLTYKGKNKEGYNIYFEVEYYKPGRNGLEKQFTLRPVVQLNPRMGNAAEPDTRHLLLRDIYTHVTYVDPEYLEADNPDRNSFRKPLKRKLAEGDTLATSNSLIVYKGLSREVDPARYNLGKSDIAVRALLEIVDLNKQKYTASPVFVLRNNNFFSVDTTVSELGLRIGFAGITPEENKVELEISEKWSNYREFIIMQAIVFPYINILWTGCILFIIGSFIAIRKRLKTET